MMRILVSGGPGAGCTSTAKMVAGQLGVRVIDSDSYFHKPTDPPFQAQYSPEERRLMLGSALAAEQDWILSGSVATWGLEALALTHGVFLYMSREVRLARLLKRQRTQFGSRIDPGGDMQEEHELFMEWAAGYEERTERARNLMTDRSFMEAHCTHVLVLTEDEEMDVVVAKIVGFLAEYRE